MLVSIKCMKTKYAISRVAITRFKCHLTSLLPRNIIIYMGGLMSMPLGKKKGALYIDTQKSVKHLLGKFLD